jgi:hypothetical protein
MAIDQPEDQYEDEASVDGILTPGTGSATNGADTIVGTDGGETLGSSSAPSGNGNDTIYGLGGDDTLLGGTGADTLYGGAGVDSLSGGVGDDELFGGSGNDTLAGNNGDDELTGGLGDDTLTGGNDPDTFVFRFELTQGGGGSLSFTEWLEANELNADSESWTQGFFSSNYTNWILDEVFSAGNRGLLGIDPDAVITVGINQNDDDPTATPLIYVGGVLDEELSAMFGGRDSFDWTSGGRNVQTHTRYWSDTFELGAAPTLEGEGYDTITDWGTGTDTIEFAGLGTGDINDLLGLMALSVADADGDGGADDTVVSWDGGSITILNTTEWADLGAFLGSDGVVFDDELI